MNIEQVQIVVFAWRCSPTRELARWLDAWARRGGRWRFAPQSRPVDLAREQVCNGHLAAWRAGGPRRLVMLDADLALDGGAAELFATDSPVAYCGHVGHQGTRGHYGHDDFGCAACAIDAEVLARLDKPWFRFAAIDDVLAACECVHFRERLDGAGIAHPMVGRVWHLQAAYYGYDDGGHLACRWPMAFEQGEYR